MTPVGNPPLRWSDVERLAATVAQIITSAAWRPDTIVAVARGGLVPAQLIAHRLDVREVATVGARFADAARTEMLIYATPLWADQTPRRVLLVEDAVDTGRLMRAAAAGLAGDVRTAALVAVGVWRPHYLGMATREVPAMPWELAGGATRA